MKNILVQLNIEYLLEHFIKVDILKKSNVMFLKLFQ
jgi:hypothetical protein